MRQRGYTFVGIMVAISIAAVIGITIMSSVQNDSRVEFLKRVPLVIDRLHSAVESYYDARCQAGAVTNPSLADLVSGGYLDSVSQVALPMDAAITQISIVNGGSPRAQFLYTVTFGSNSDAEVAGANHFNVTVTDNTATWNITGRTNHDSSSAESHEYLRAFGGSSC